MKLFGALLELLAEPLNVLPVSAPVESQFDTRLTRVLVPPEVRGLVTARDGAPVGLIAMSYNSLLPALVAGRLIEARQRPQLFEASGGRRTSAHPGGLALRPKVHNALPG